jgi:hypothetical protein
LFNYRRLPSASLVAKSTRVNRRGNFPHLGRRFAREQDRNGSVSNFTKYRAHASRDADDSIGIGAVAVYAIVAFSLHIHRPVARVEERVAK